MVDRAWIDRFRGFCHFHLCKVWTSIVGERPLSTGEAIRGPSKSSTALDPEPNGSNRPKRDIRTGLLHSIGC
jgi:hypothetical protein